MEPEKWLPVVGFEGWYEVSDQGQIRSLERTIVRKDGRVQIAKGCVLRHGTAGAGYAAVGLHRNGTALTRYVHALVMEAFVGSRPPGYQTRHLNGNPRDCRLVNLAYGTAVENAADKVLHGTARTRLVKATHCARKHPFDDENTGFNSDGLRYCRTCRRERDREKKRELRTQGLTAGDSRHGTVTGYINFYCRCEPCLKAAREYRQMRRSAWNADC
ncbi:NUMOD4 motif-containing HNH endonuclease [Mycobacterium sp. E1747]|uniref:NUMOD4 motif-containing HNH endonuclease n=1 Tax=Mycobacterium sp. E1747 TaxID=1834128 RepID=UPI0018D3BEA1